MPTRSKRKRARRDSFTVYDYEDLAKRGRREDARDNSEIRGRKKSETAKLYCFCQRVSFGEMIGCDGEDCKIEGSI